MISFINNFFRTAGRNLGPALSTVLLVVALTVGAYLIFKCIKSFGTKKDFKEGMLYLLFAVIVLVVAYAFGSNGGLFNAAGQAVSVTDPMQLVS